MRHSRGANEPLSAVKIGPRKCFSGHSRQGTMEKAGKNYPAKSADCVPSAGQFVRDKCIYQAQRIYSHACTVKALERNSKIRDFIDASRDHSTTIRNIISHFQRSMDGIPSAHGRVFPKTPRIRGCFVRDNNTGLPCPCRMYGNQDFELRASRFPSLPCILASCAAAPLEARRRSP